MFGLGISLYSFFVGGESGDQEIVFPGSVNSAKNPEGGIVSGVPEKLPCSYCSEHIGFLESSAPGDTFFFSVHRLLSFEIEDSSESPPDWPSVCKAVAWAGPNFLVPRGITVLPLHLYQARITLDEPSR